MADKVSARSDLLPAICIQSVPSAPPPTQLASIWLPSSKVATPAPGHLLCSPLCPFLCQPAVCWWCSHPAVQQGSGAGRTALSLSLGAVLAVGAPVLTGCFTVKPGTPWAFGVIASLATHRGASQLFVSQARDSLGFSVSLSAQCQATEPHGSLPPPSLDNWFAIGFTFILSI